MARTKKNSETNSTNAPKDDPEKDIERRQFKRELPVPLQGEELNRKAVKAAQQRAQAAEMQRELDDVVKPKKRAIRKLESDAAKLEKEVAEKSKTELVLCEERRDFRVNEVIVVRCDTGEVLDGGPRALTGMERQRSMKLSDAKAETVVLPDAAEKGAVKP